MLILQHEQQHLVGRDPLILWAAVLVVVVLPWNLPLWWQLRRLRLAIELDCDARVLRAGADAGNYGEVLFAVTRRAAGLRGLAIAMGQPMSALERRIRNLVRVSPRHGGLQSVGAMLVAVSGVTAAAMLNAPALPGMSPDHAVQLVDAGTSPQREVVTGGNALAPPPFVETTAAPPIALTEPAAMTLAAAAPSVAASQTAASDRAISSDPLACLDADLLRGLLLQPSSLELHVSMTPPAELAAFRAPRELQWVASAERSYASGMAGVSAIQTSVAAVYRSSLPSDAARNAASRALITAGWKQQHDGPMMNSGVFNSDNIFWDTETYCREGVPLTFTSSAVDGVAYLSLSVARNPGASVGFYNQCDQPPRPAPVAGALDAYLPKLDLPRDPASGRPATTRGSGGPGRCETGCRAYSSFRLKDSITNVSRHFASQMAGQGWTADTSWSGTGSAGSTWTRRSDTDLTLQATLTVVEFADGQFTATFKAARTE